MTNARENFAEEGSMGVVVLVYYGVVLAAFFIGIYGLFNLIWLAGMAVEENARTLTLL